MQLYSTKYPNNIRQVSGTPDLLPDDVVLECDTSTAPVVINLLEIPDNKWMTTWKLYIIDISGNAYTNNITINAGAGQTINGVSSIVITQNSGSVITRIVNNNSFIGTFSYTTAPSPVDTGWLDLQGFAWIDAAARPQYRVIGKQLVFRRLLVIPVDKAGAPAPWVNSFSYATETVMAPCAAGTGGVVTNAAGLITFNQGLPVLQNASHYPDTTYTTNWIVGSQRKEAQAPVGNNYYALYTGVFLVQITNAGLMRIITLKNTEEGKGGQQIGQSALRYLTPESITGRRVLDYRNITDAAAGASTLIGRSNVGTPNDAVFIGLNSDAANHLVTHDPAEEDEVGGYVLPLESLKAYLS